MEPFLARTFALADELLADERASTPRPKLSPAELGERLPLRPGSEGRPEDEVFDLLRELIAHTPHTADRRFLNQLFAGRVPLAAAGEMLAVLLNVSMYTFKAAGPQVLMEWELLKRMLELAGIPDGDGTFLPGGSLANLIGMLLGRNHAAPNMRDAGAPAERLTVYLSAEGHYSVRKNAGVLGIGRDQVRLVPVDAQGCMRADALEAAIQADLAAGHRPCCVVATAGTTVRGSFDPIPAIAEVAARHGVWLHVDAAVGGSLLLHPDKRALLDGIERADSITWDAHKMMGVPLTCSALLVRDPASLVDSLQEAADYLFQADGDHLNPGKRSIQCGRRNDALKLWAAWQHLGDAGWAERLERQLELARYAAERVAAHPRLELCEEPPLVMVCFTAPGKSSAAICERLRDSGEALIGYGDCAGVEAIRLVTMNPDLRESDLDALFDAIADAADALPEEDQRDPRSAAAKSA